MLPSSLAFVQPMFLLMVLLASCGNTPQDENNTVADNSPVAIAGFAIPRLNSPEKQLSYAQSSRSIGEKRAALQAIEILYPANRLYIGLAELELAYLLSGSDFRLATQQQCLLAMEHYEAIFTKFSDIPDISTKALWYLGWITTELLHDKKKGIEYYRKITVDLESPRLQFYTPIPWFSVKSGQDMQSHEAFLERSNLSWADLAHLELIRNTPDKETAFSSLASLYTKNSLGLVTGLGLKAALQRHEIEKNSEFMLEQYLMNSKDNPLLTKDIMALKVYKPTRDLEHHENSQ